MSYVAVPFPGCGKYRSFTNIEQALTFYRGNLNYLALLSMVANKPPYVVIEQRY
jgi:hypothetical protein